jgi:hypothetical protein
MECVAKRDGQFDGRYIYEGETFEAKRCPTWADPVKKAPKAAAKTETSAESKGDD